MKLIAGLAAVFLVAACGDRAAQADASTDEVSLATAAAPPPVDPAEVASLDGKALFTQRCGMCHQTIGMAVGILSRRPADASNGLLEERTDLSALFIQTAVRTGILNMPRMPRAEVSDPELAAIANYLSRGKP